MPAISYPALRVLNGSIRTIKTVPVKKEIKKYSDTIHLPKTSFPSWLNANQAIEKDKLIIKTCGFQELYSWQRKHIRGEEFILHDGPPYANGFPHMGHAINKILKDIIMRHKLLKGYKIHYKPGWDCHGLPIELKALSGLSASNMKPIEIRKQARMFAEKAITDQSFIFQSWGVMADWKDGCYYTFNKSYVKNQLQQFWKLYEKGLIYRDLKPVHWSPSSKTALAEAELVYNDHKSLTVALRYKLCNLSPTLAHAIPSNHQSSNAPIYLVIWTTTPWTLPSNQAVAFNPLLEYSLVSSAANGPLYIFASEALIIWKEKMNIDFTTLATFPGSALEGNQYIGWQGKRLPVVSSDHVTGGTGTGLVHSAPAHGHEDFLLALKHNLPIECYVDENGNYEAGLDDSLTGTSVLSANNAVMKLLSNDILHTEVITHSYPYDWRTNQPVIIRASQQWFFDSESVKSRALEILKDVEIVPGGGEGLRGKLETRLYWCISRQRVWGVPIPALYISGQPIVHKELIDHYCDLIDKEGTDFWWSLPLETLLPENILGKLNININDVTVGKDILDIWFDSGLSWSRVLEGKTADLYVEGLDQFTGWFQSSLLTSVALQDKAPYKKLFVHGFAVDENGRKMSKSVGNVVNPQDIVSGKLDKQKSSGCGVDLIRWWVGAHGHHASVPVSSTTLSNSKDALYKIRNVSKFLLGALRDYPIDITTPKLRVIDNYALHSLLDFQEQVDELYESFQYNKVCLLINNYVVNQLSSLYLHLIKDRLYCEEEDSPARRAVQFVIYHILEGLVKSFAPIMPVLAEEIYSFHPHNQDKIPFFMSERIVLDRSKLASQYKVVPVVDQALAVKALLQKESPINCNSTQLGCIIEASPCVYKILRILQKEPHSDLSELTELLQVSNVSLIQDESIDSFNVQVKASEKELCGRCRRNTSTSKDALCKRCDYVLTKQSTCK